jgi:hypothetical protein
MTIMADITMCQNHDCPIVDNCWRYSAPPDLKMQSYAEFVFDDDDFDRGGNGCKYYIAMDVSEYFIDH